VTADFNGPYDPADPNPYFVVRILDANCASCNIPASQKTVTGHIRAGQPNRITVTCMGGSCKTSKNIELTLGVDSNATHNGRQESIVFSWLFRQPVEQFYLMDFNIATANTDFDITQRNR